MKQVRARRLAFSLLTSAMVLASVGQVNADVIIFTNGRTLTVKDYRISGDTVTVTLRHGGEATFATALISQVGPGDPGDLADRSDGDGEAADLPSAPAASLPVGGKKAADARPFAALIDTVALKHGIDPALVHAVVEAESNYRPRARSHVGARGLMQVMPATGRDLGVRSATLLFDPEANLEAGVKYLKWLLERFNGNLTSALAAYNAGPGAVTRYQGVPPYPETRNYVRKVLENFQQ